MTVQKNLKKMKSCAPTTDSDPASSEAVDDTEDDDGAGLYTLIQVRQLFPKPVHSADDHFKNKIKVAFCARGPKRK